MISPNIKGVDIIEGPTKNTEVFEFFGYYYPILVLWFKILTSNKIVDNKYINNLSGLPSRNIN